MPLSGGGPREKVFWHNYFFHCAYTRYEAGLSIDEIWSFQPEKVEAAKEALQKAEQKRASDEEVVVFGETEDDVASTPDAAFVPDETAGEKNDGAAGDKSISADVEESSPSGSATSEFEMLDGGDMEAGAGDTELDELEAEIARELED